jgi:predicted acylesterase/phospholipase RssA
MIKYLVLSGGGHTMFHYMGIFKILLEKNYINLHDIKSIYGTSSGSIISVMLCLGYEWEDLVDYIIRCPWEKKLKVGVDKAINIFENNGLYDEMLFHNIFKPLLNGKNLKLDTTLEEFYVFSNIELHIYTFELNEFISVDLSYKSHPNLKLIDALRMSCSIPLLIKPICQDGKCYIDGGVQANYPVNICLQNENCDEREIFGFKNCLATLKPLDDDSNITDYLNIILRNCFHLMSIQPKKITNELDIHTNGISFDELMNALCEKHHRERLVNVGISKAENYLLENKKEETEN